MPHSRLSPFFYKKAIFKYSRFVTAIAASMGAVSPIGVIADDAISYSNQLDTIIIKGELQERDLQETQSSVAVITGEELENREDVDFYYDVVERTPGISSAFGEKGFVIRGIDQRGPGGDGGSGGGATYRLLLMVPLFLIITN